MKVFVLNYLSDPADDMSTSDVLGVYKTKEEAQKEMKKSFMNKVLDLGIEEDEVNGFEVKFCETDDEYSIYHYGSFYKWRIYDSEI